MNVRQTAVRFAVATILVVLAGVAAESRARAESPQEGSYGGDYAFRSANRQVPNQSGVLHMTISETGAMTVKFANKTLGALGSGTGAVDEDGTLECVAKLQGVSYSLKGTVTKTKAGNLKGTITQYSGRQVVGVVEFDLPAE